ncbi:MAG TPA: phospholipase D-like domain-containing protein [Sedimentisphaerales bacterium]|nr:phospholipase D-like domain-containing protein [Sedimentisphaerales bacterium]
MKLVPSFLKLLQSPWDEDFGDVIRTAQESLVIASPYIGMEPCRRIISEKSVEKLQRKLAVLVVTDLSRDNLLSGSTDVGAIHELAASFPRTEVIFLPSIHAKVYIADIEVAIVTSGNMTASGLSRNYEYGVRFDNRGIVRRIRADVEAYSDLGTKIDVEKLKFLLSVSLELREMRAKAERTMKSRLRAEFRRRMQRFDDEIVRARVAGRAPHAIFGEAILYLLGRRPMSTQDLHPLVQRIHPDLCDDTVDRVIDGKHFGKKWKHGVRTAQQHLKKEGLIELRDGVWYLREK